MKLILICSVLFFAASCHIDTKQNKPEELMKFADTVTVLFYNASLPPKNQFFSTLILFKNGYVCRTDFGDNALKSIEFKRPLDSLFWDQIRVFNPANINPQNQNDGETFSIQYKYLDSVYIHYPDSISENHKKIRSLIDFN